LLDHDLIGDRLPGANDAFAGSPYSRPPSVFEWHAELDDKLIPDEPRVLARLHLGHDLRFGPDWTEEYFDAHLDVGKRSRFRWRLSTVGADADWVARVHPAWPAPAPFDEPVLGIIGMWCWGGGANPHFALALATICERIGQGPLAVDAYERCVELAEGFSRDDAQRAALIAHCRARQEAIARSIAPLDPSAWLAADRQRHAAELQWACARRAAARTAEIKAIAAGKSLDDIPLGDGDAKPLASSPGTSDEHWGVPPRRFAGDGIACALIGMAVVAWLGLLRERLAGTVRRRP
jgi:hypothetical protein